MTPHDLVRDPRAPRGTPCWMPRSLKKMAGCEALCARRVDRTLSWFYGQGPCRYYARLQYVRTNSVEVTIAIDRALGAQGFSCELARKRRAPTTRGSVGYEAHQIHLRDGWRGQL